MYNRYKDYFKSIQNVHVVLGDITKYKAECVATAGNSFGIMDGGIDSTLDTYLGEVQEDVQQHIKKYYFGECSVGSSFIVKAKKECNFKYLCYVPTMRVPKNTLNTLNAYYAMRSALVTCLNCKLKDLIVPVFCTGVGRMSTKEALRQYKEAFYSVFGETSYKWPDIIHKHRKLIDED